jgi:hypothetical protein
VEWINWFAVRDVFMTFCTSALIMAVGGAFIGVAEWLSSRASS